MHQGVFALQRSQHSGFLPGCDEQTTLVHGFGHPTQHLSVSLKARAKMAPWIPRLKQAFQIVQDQQGSRLAHVFEQEADASFRRDCAVCLSG